jgi:hypothetical protein
VVFPTWIPKWNYYIPIGLIDVSGGRPNISATFSSLNAPTNPAPRPSFVARIKSRTYQVMEAHSKGEAIAPMKWDTLKNENSWLYEKVRSN